MTTTEAPEPFKVAVERANGEMRTFVLMKKNVVLRGGKIQPIHYFVSEASPSPSDPDKFEYLIHESHRTEVSDDTLVTVGRAMMDLLGMTAERAAELNGNLAADVRTYNKEERNNVINELRRKLSEPPQ